MISNEKSVGAVIFRKDGEDTKYLLLHYQFGHWDFPKGHPEKGEDDIQALKREVREETGIEDINIIPGFKKQIRYFYRAGKEESEKRIEEGIGTNVIKKVINYIAETKTSEVKISFEHIGHEWLNYENALKRITFKNSKDVLEEANNYLQKTNFLL